LAERPPLLFKSPQIHNIIILLVIQIFLQEKAVEATNDIILLYGIPAKLPVVSVPELGTCIPDLHVAA
jgi:hypothetical protein